MKKEVKCKKDEIIMMMRRVRSGTQFIRNYSRKIIPRDQESLININMMVIWWTNLITALIFGNIVDVIVIS